MKAERPFRLRTPDNKVIYGTLNTPSRPTDTAIIFVHGLTGHQNEHIFFNAARYFSQRGIATVRFNLYGSETDARKLHQCTVRLHANDLNLVVKRYLRRFRAIFLVGHSLGGPTILLADTGSVRGAVGSYILTGRNRAAIRPIRQETPSIPDTMAGNISLGKTNAARTASFSRLRRTRGPASDSA